MTADLEAVRPAVLARYGPLAAGLNWVPLGATGGFSGAHVWRGERGGSPVLALKAWPPAGMTVERLVGIHRVMARAAHLPFVPAVARTDDGSTGVVAAGRVWDVTAWMPGAADFHLRPSAARLAAAAAALARLHLAWRPSLGVAGPSPGVRARLRSIVRWRALAAGRTGPDVRQHPALAAPAARGWRAVAAAADRAERVLREWEGRPVPTQPCLRDVWGAHVLFTGEAVTGLVDYGSVNDDHVGTDLARMLGDLVGDDAGRFAAGLAAYRAAGGVLDAPDEFVRTLDRTGAVGAVITWLLRLHGGTYAHPDWPAVAARLDRLAARVERNFPG